MLSTSTAVSADAQYKWGLKRLLQSEERTLRVQELSVSEPWYSNRSLAASGPPVHLYALIESVAGGRLHGEMPEEPSRTYPYGMVDTTGDEWFNFREARTAAGEASAPIDGMRPALYSQVRPPRPQLRC